MEEINSYYGMARNDYLFAKSSIETGRMLGNFNVTTSLFAQSGEKFLKAVLELKFLEDSEVMRLLHSHNLRALYNKISTKYKLSVSSMECKWLGDFYYDARYPGDDFVLTTEADALQCMQIVEKLHMDIDCILKEDEKERDAARKTLEQLKAF